MGGEARKAEMAFGRLGRAARSLAYPAVAARVEKTRGAVVELGWAEGATEVWARVRGTGGEAHAVWIGMRRVGEKGPKGAAEALWSEGGGAGWVAWSSCSCPFFAQPHAEGACKHVVAVAELAGEQAEARAQARSIAACARDPGPALEGSAPKRRL